LIVDDYTFLVSDKKAKVFLDLSLSLRNSSSISPLV